MSNEAANWPKKSIADRLCHFYRFCDEYDTEVDECWCVARYDSHGRPQKEKSKIASEQRKL